MTPPDQPVFSRADVEAFQPEGWERSYLIAPMTIRERNAARADVVAEAGLYPPQNQLFVAMREALQDAAPENLDHLLALLDEAEHNPTDLGATARMAPIETACMAAPGYRALLAQRIRYMDAVPLIYARHALRGWEGPQLPPFRRERELVPFALLDPIPEDELKAVGLRAFALAQVSAAATGNFKGPSPSSGPLNSGKAGSARRTAARGLSGRKSARKTRA